MSAEDRLAIMEQVANYAYAWDVMDADAYTSIFAEDGVFEIDPQAPDGPALLLTGSDEIRAWALKRFSRRGGARLRHCPLGTVFQSLSGDRARTRTIQISTHIEAGESTPNVAHSSVYFDDWKRTAAGWQLIKRSLHHDDVG